MLWLTLVICLQDGSMCRERRDFEPFAMPMACAVAAQQAAAAWLAAMPGWRLAEARCEPEARRQVRL